MSDILTIQRPRDKFNKFGKVHGVSQLFWKQLIV